MPSSMNAPSSSFTGSIPRLYHDHLGPVNFDPDARDLAARVPDRAGTRVLEIACGTGIVTRHLLQRLPADALLIATDLNAAMVDEALNRLPADSRLSTRAADAQALPFPDGSFDAVVIQFGVMFFPDKPGALREARRMLAPGGVLIFNVWGTLADNPFSRITHETIGSFFPDDPPTFYLTPFGWNDRDALHSTTREAGFPDVTIDTVDARGHSESADHFSHGLVFGNPVSLTIAERGVVDGETVRAAVAARLAAELGERPCVSPMRAHVVTGRN